MYEALQRRWNELKDGDAAFQAKAQEVKQLRADVAGTVEGHIFSLIEDARARLDKLDERMKTLSKLMLGGRQSEVWKKFDQYRDVILKTRNRMQRDNFVSMAMLSKAENECKVYEQELVAVEADWAAE